MQKFTKHHFLATGTYIQKCFAEPWEDWAVVSNKHEKTIKWEAVHNSLQRDTDSFSPVNLICWSRHLPIHFLLSLVWWLVTPILMIKCDLYETIACWLQLCFQSDGHVTRYSLVSWLTSTLSHVKYSEKSHIGTVLHHFRQGEATVYKNKSPLLKITL